MVFLPQPGPYREPEDRNAWREDDEGRGRGRRPNLSTTQIFVGLFGVMLLLGLVAFLLIERGGKPEAEIISPQQDAHLPAGNVTIRIRAIGADESITWELSYTRAAAPAERISIASGNGSVPRIDVRPGYGLHLLNLPEPDVYQLHLVVSDPKHGETEDAVEFTVVQP
jgi:hypothetical protein